MILTETQFLFKGNFLQIINQCFKMLEVFNQFVSGLLISYLLWGALSHPKSPLPRRCPKINFGKRVQILPRLKIFYKENKAFIFHHWLCATLILVLCLFLSSGSILFRGMLVGCISQGLSYQDRFQLKEAKES